MQIVPPIKAGKGIAIAGQRPRQVYQEVLRLPSHAQDLAARDRVPRRRVLPFDQQRVQHLAPRDSLSGKPPAQVSGVDLDFR